MDRKAVSGIMLSLLLIGMLTLAFNIQRAEALEPPATEWARTYGGYDDDVAFSVVETSDGGFALAGYTYSFGAGGDFWLVKVDSSGNIQWNGIYGGAGWDDAQAVVETSDGGYVLAGYTVSFGAGEADFWLVKVDSSGNHEWNKTYRGRIAYSVVETSDGGYAVAGYTWLRMADFFLVKVDSSGNIQWNGIYGGASDDVPNSIVETSDGGCAMAGYTWSFGAGGDFWLVKVDSSGNIQWNGIYGGAGWDDAQAVVETSDGGYVLAGYTESFGAGEADAWLVKVDPLGNIEWNKTYGGAKSDTAASVVETGDGGYAFAGNTYSFALGYGDFRLVKVARPPAPPPPPPPVGGKAIPINKVIIEPELQPPWIWLSTIILPMVATGIYLKKRKRNTEINS